MPLIRLLLNNSFWLLLIALVVALYAYYNSEHQPTKSSAQETQNSPIPITLEQSSTIELNPTQPEQNAAIEAPQISTETVKQKNTDQNVIQREQQILAESNENQDELPTETIKSEPQTINEAEITTTPAPSFPSDDEMEQVLQTESPPPATSEAPPRVLNPQTATMQNANPQIQSKAELLQQARQAVEQGNLALAQNRYTQLLQMQPNANLLGEIANQLYRLGHQEMAEYAWVEAFNFLLYERRYHEAQQLSGQLQSIAPRAYQMIMQQFPQFSTPQSSESPTPSYGQNYQQHYYPTTPQNFSQP